MSFTSYSCGRPSQVFSVSMGKSNIRPMDSVNNKRRLQNGVYHKPPYSGIRNTKVKKSKATIISREIDNRLAKDAIEKLPMSDIHQGFYSTLFLVPKKNGQTRPVINLRPLNQFLSKNISRWTPFKML